MVSKEFLAAENERLAADVFFWKAIAFAGWFWLITIMVCVLLIQ